MGSVEMVRYHAQDGTDVELRCDELKALLGLEGVGDAAMRSLMAKFAARGLNPLAGDCYVNSYNGTLSLVVSKDYYTRTAREHGASWEAGVAVVTRDGELAYREGCIVGSATERLVGGWAQVWMPDVERPFRYEASFAEYDTGKALWRSKPATMIRKVALVSAIREALPSCFGGTYDEAEMPEADGAQPIEAVPDEVD